MIILLISEIRSGSTNLAKWLKESLPSFQLLNEPYNPRSNHYIGNGKIDVNKNYIISEKYFNNEKLLNELINISDVVFCLYREDFKNQMESYVIAELTQNWYDVYVDNVIIQNIDTEFNNKKDSFRKQKDDFQSFITKNNLPKYTYEELYYGDKINDLKQFLEIDSNVHFPYGEKYRHSDIIKKIV